jgi:hypothetical protein
MEFCFVGKVELTLKHDKEKNKTTHVSTDFSLGVPRELDENHYLKNGIPNAIGTKSLQNCLVQGLIGVIHLADQKGYCDSATNLRKIISELEKGTFSVATVEFGKFKTGE